MHLDKIWNAPLKVPCTFTKLEHRLIASAGNTTSEINGYLAITQFRNGRVQLITIKDLCKFNLERLKALPPAVKK